MTNKCEACGIQGLSEAQYILVRTINGCLNLCEMCLANINGKHPEVKALRASWGLADDERAVEGKPCELLVDGPGGSPKRVSMADPKQFDRLRTAYQTLKEAIWNVPGESHESFDEITHEETRRQAIDQARAFEEVNPLVAENERMKQLIESYGNNPAGFDWGVLKQIDQLEAALEAKDAAIHTSNACVRPLMEKVAKLEAENERLTEENERLVKKGHQRFTHTADGRPCYYCGEPCNSLAGNPSEWPIPLCHSDEPGKVKSHHIGCVMKRLNERDVAFAELAALRDRLARLEAVLAEAVEKCGHSMDCPSILRTGAKPCNCWRSRAAALEETK